MIDDREKIRNADTSPDAREEENARTGYISYCSYTNGYLRSLLKQLARAESRTEILAYLGGRTTWSAICHWDQGRRRIPDWLLTFLEREVAKQHAINQTRLDCLKRKGRP